MTPTALIALSTLILCGACHAEDAKPVVRSEAKRGASAAQPAMQPRRGETASDFDAAKGHVEPVTAKTVSRDPYATPLFLNAKTLRM